MNLENRFRVLVCIDGSDESYRAMRYAVRLAGGEDGDIVLVYVRPVDQGLRTGGLQVRVARENMLNWGLELPGLNYLKKGRDILIETGAMEEGWTEKTFHVDAYNDPLGDNKIEYHSPTGKMVVLKLKVAPTITTGILEQFDIAPYDLVVVGASEYWRKGRTPSFWRPAVAEEIAESLPCSVLVSRELESGHGHLVCIDGTDHALDMALKDAILASRCNCPLSLLSVAETEDGRAVAEEAVTRAKEEIEDMGIDVVECLVLVGDPAETIIEAGADYSVICISESNSGTLRRILKGSVTKKVIQGAHNSVMVVR